MMKSKRWTRIVIGSIAALVLAAGVLWGFARNTEVALAQEVEQAIEGGKQMFARGGPGGFSRGVGRSQGNGEALLANALGITEAELQAAHQAAFESAIDQAVADGLLTEEQAEQMKERSGFRSGGIRGFLDVGNADALLAEALGISEEELETPRNTMIEKGVEAGLLTEAQGNDLTVMKMMRDSARDAIDAALQEAVEAGLITQEQADNLFDGRKGGFGGFDHQRGRGGRMGGFHDFGGEDHGRGSGGRGGFPGSDSDLDGSQYQTPETTVPATGNL